MAGGGALPARVGGAALRALFSAALLVRRPGPIYADGLILRGHITMIGTSVQSGISWVTNLPTSP